MFDKIRHLKPWDQITYAGFTYSGSPYHVQMTVKALSCDGPDTYLLNYRKHPTKSLGQMKLHPRKQFIIWPGWVAPNTDVAASGSIIENSCVPVRILKRWGHDDPRYLTRALASVVTEPFIVNIKPIVQPERLFDLCTVIG